MTRNRILLQRYIATAALGACLTFASTGRAADTDLDGIDDAVDNCPALANSAQFDSDGEGGGDACDADYNNDGVVNEADAALFRASFNSEAGDGAYASIFDHNADGLIDGADFALLQSLARGR